MRHVILCLAICFVNFSFGQLMNGFDTLEYNDRMNGSIDSMDIISSPLISIFDGGANNISYRDLSVNYLYLDMTQFTFQRFYPVKQPVISALPHIGFSYVFGSKGVQNVKTAYSQVFRKNFIVNLNYTKNSATGFLRNADFKRSDLQLNMVRRGNIYNFNLSANYDKDMIHHPGGVVTDTLIEDFGLEFTPVRKSNAESLLKRGNVNWENYIRLYGDSSKSVGFASRHEYRIASREYMERDTLYGIYDFINTDDDTTRDQYNLASIENGLGLYYNNAARGLYVDFSFNGKYWDLQNLGLHHYRGEYNLINNLKYNKRFADLSNNFYLNVQGAFNEWEDRFAVFFDHRLVDADLSGEFGSYSPLPLMRHYFANNATYEMASVSNQQRALIEGKLWYRGFEVKQLVFYAKYSYAALAGNYYFNSAFWDNNVLESVSYSSSELSVQWKYKNLHLQPRFVYVFNKEEFLPETQTYVRLFVKGKLFRTKKLEAVCGIDFSYIGAFRNKIYLPFMDTYDWLSVGSYSEAHTNLHFFTSFGIDEFRFFVRYENIGYFWNNKKISVAEGYPLPGTGLKIGITWDFFN